MARISSNGNASQAKRRSPVSVRLNGSRATGWSAAVVSARAVAHARSRIAGHDVVSRAAPCTSEAPLANADVIASRNRLPYSAAVGSGSTIAPAGRACSAGASGMTSNTMFINSTPEIPSTIAWWIFESSAVRPP